MLAIPTGGKSSLREVSMSNFFVVSEGGTLSSGFPVRRDTRKLPFILVQMVTVRLVKSPDGTVPKIIDETLLEARPCHDEVATNLLGKRLLSKGTWQGALLYINANKLWFEEHLATEFRIQNAWPGAETVTKPFLERGARGTSMREQLLAVEDGESVIVADRNGQPQNRPRYITYTCNRGALTHRPTYAYELAAGLAERALRLNLSRDGLAWTKHTLHDLDYSSAWTDELEEKMNKASRPRK